MLKTSPDRPSISIRPQRGIMRPQPVDVMTPSLPLMRPQMAVVRPQPVGVMTPNLPRMRPQTDIVRPQPVNAMTPNLRPMSLRMSLRDTSQPKTSCRTLDQEQPRLHRSKAVEASFDVEGKRRAMKRRLERQWKSSHQPVRLGRSIQCRSAAVISDNVYLRYDTLEHLKRA